MTATDQVNMYRRPIITLSGGGDSVTLDGVGRGYTLKPGSTGLGLAPVEITATDLAAGGAVVRHRRRTVREIFLPFDVHLGTGASEYGDLEAQRRRLEQICAGEVSIQVQGASSARTAVGYLTSGLGGDFSTAIVNTTRMSLGLTFACHDPSFYGTERVREWGLSSVIKPYWTRFPRLPHYPAWLSSSTVLGVFEFDVSGDEDAYPVWTIHPPGGDLLIECENGCGKRLFLSGEIDEPVTFDSRTEEITSPSMTNGELWDRMSLDSQFFTLPPGQNRVRISMVGATGTSKVRLAYREAFQAGH